MSVRIRMFRAYNKIQSHKTAWRQTAARQCSPNQPREHTSRLKRGLFRHVFCPDLDPCTPPKVYSGESVSAFTLKAGIVRVAMLRTVLARAVITTRATS